MSIVHDITKTQGYTSLPESAGVYFFRGDDDAILYIGKATSLKDRVKSYFSQDIAVTRGPKIVRMVALAKNISWQQTDSVLEALVLEALLIKQYQPPYNTDEKDDKSFQYVVITKEQFPRVLIVRGRDMEAQKNETTTLRSKRRGNMTDVNIKYFFGPFPSGGSLKEALRIVRKIFPFRDTCTPLSEQRRQLATVLKKPCFHAQLGLCPGVCSGVIDAREYAQTIRNIKLFFEGKKSIIVKKLEKEMKLHAKNLAFENAQKIKKTLFALQHIQDVSLLKKDILEVSYKKGFRIEAYDVAHLSGKNVVGVMTVVEDGFVNRAEYRKFILKTETNNDVGNLLEILTRRLQHEEWRFPDVLVVDGNDAQLTAAKRALDIFEKKIPVVGIVKDTHHKPKDIIGDEEMISQWHDALLLANSEAHRYAITFHRKRRAANFLKM